MPVAKDFDQCMAKWQQWHYTDRKEYLRDLLNTSCVPNRQRPKLLITVLKSHSMKTLTTDNIQNIHQDKWQSAESAKIFPLMGNPDILVDELLRSYAVVEGDAVRFAPLMRRVAGTLLSLLLVQQQQQPAAATNSSGEQGKDTTQHHQHFHPDVYFIDLLESYHSLLHNPYHRVAELFVGGSFFLGTLCKQLHHFVALHIPKVVETVLRAHRTVNEETLSIPLKHGRLGLGSPTNNNDGDQQDKENEAQEVVEEDPVQTSEQLLFLACNGWFLTIFQEYVLPSDIPTIWTHFVCFGWKFMLALALQFLEEACTLESSLASSVALHELPDEMILDAISYLPSCVADLDATIRRSRKWYRVLSTSTLLSIERRHIEDCGRRQAARERAAEEERQRQKMNVVEDTIKFNGTHTETSRWDAQRQNEREPNNDSKKESGANENEAQNPLLNSPVSAASVFSVSDDGSSEEKKNLVEDAKDFGREEVQELSSSPPPALAPLPPPTTSDEEEPPASENR